MKRAPQLLRKHFILYVSRASRTPPLFLSLCVCAYVCFLCVLQAANESAILDIDDDEEEATKDVADVRGTAVL